MIRVRNEIVKIYCSVITFIQFSCITGDVIKINHILFFAVFAVQRCVKAFFAVVFRVHQQKISLQYFTVNVSYYLDASDIKDDLQKHPDNKQEKQMQSVKPIQHYDSTIITHIIV